MGFDKSKSYKFVNCKFEERTPEEQAELERKRAAHLAASGQGPTVKAAQAKLPRSNERFIRVTLSQANRLLWLKPQAFVATYLLLSLESFKAHGQPFTWPADTLTIKFGINRLAQWRAMAKLVQAGLISVEQAPPKPPKVTVL
jgi:hypothetical protein